PTGANHWSVECWVKMPSLPSGGTTYFMCLCLGTVTTGGKTIAIYYFAGTTKSFVLDNDNGFDIASTAAPVAGTTYHLVGTYDGSKMQFYVNGTAQNTGTAATMNLTYGSAYIGNDGSGDYFGGIIDEVAIYNVTLTATQVTNHYNAGLAITKVAPIRSKLRTQRTPSTSVRTFLRNSRTDTNPARSVIRTAQTRTNSLRSPLRSRVTRLAPMRSPLRTQQARFAPVRSFLKNTQTGKSPVRSLVTTPTFRALAMRSPVRTKRQLTSPMRSFLRNRQTPGSPMRGVLRNQQTKNTSLRGAIRTGLTRSIALRGSI